jgi:hypothetical protein
MKNIFLAIILLAAFTSCTNYGKKIKVEGTKAEVYYKGDGVTEEDARNTGDFLKKENFFSSGKGASVQISKEGEAYIMRFVYDKDVYDTLKNIDNLFKMLAARASADVFNGKKVNIALASKSFKDYKTIPYDEHIAKELETGDPGDVKPITSKADFTHKAEAGVDYYWYGIPDEEARIFTDYVTSTGSFSGGTAELYMTMENGRYIVRFPMLKEGRDNPATMAKVEEVSRQIKENVFKDIAYSFYATDENLVTVKAFDY